MLSRAARVRFVRRLVVEAALLLVGEQLFELALSLGLQGRHVDARHAEVFHHAAPRDVAGPAVGAAAGQQQILERVEDRPIKPFED